MGFLGLTSLLMRDSHDSSSADNITSLLDISPLPGIQRRGLIAIAVIAFLSAITTFSLVCFLTYRLIYWRKYYPTYLGYNHNVILIYNLLIADLIQSQAFVINVYWVLQNAIRAQSPICFVQGLFLSAGDPGSGLFILAIALNTFATVIFGKKLEQKLFVGIVVGIWIFLAVMVSIPIIAHGTGVMVPSGVWCWINENYVMDRLLTHYLWIFLAEFGTIVLYAIMFVQLRRQLKMSARLGSAHSESVKRIRRVVILMIVYPLAYLILSLPLALGRMMTAGGHQPSLAYFCVAGAMMTSFGMTDSILYVLTRRSLLLIDAVNEHTNPSSSSRPRVGLGQGSHMRTTVSANPNRSPWLQISSKKESLIYGSQSDSMEQIVPPRNDTELRMIGKVYQSTTIEVTHEATDYTALDSDRGSNKA